MEQKSAKMARNAEASNAKIQAPLKHQFPSTKTVRTLQDFSNFFPVAATSRNKLQPGATPRNQTRENPALTRPKYRTSQEDASASR
ncbi:MAG TPA: hypothetical protein VFB72_16420 [Verrucomicrobiae bacterium]|nr:hypothetical protein [Verrucomicrobiae bacterium]